MGSKRKSKRGTLVKKMKRRNEKGDLITVDDDDEGRGLFTAR